MKVSSDILAANAAGSVGGLPATLCKDRPDVPDAGSRDLENSFPGGFRRDECCNTITHKHLRLNYPRSIQARRGPAGSSSVQLGPNGSNWVNLGQFGSVLNSR